MTQNDSLCNGITKITWGYVFILFHIKINSFDLLPDFVGYILISVGIGSLAASLSHIKLLKPLTVILTVWQTIQWLIESFSFTLPSLFGLIPIAFGTAAIIYHIILLTDISEIAEEYQGENNNIDKKLIVSRNLYAICGAVSIVMSVIALTTVNMQSKILTGILTGISALSGLAALIVMILILIALFSLRKIFNERAIIPTPDTYDIPPFADCGTSAYCDMTATENKDTE